MAVSTKKTTQRKPPREAVQSTSDRFAQAAQTIESVAYDLLAVGVCDGGASTRLAAASRSSARKLWRGLRNAYESLNDLTVITAGVNAHQLPGWQFNEEGEEDIGL